MNGMLTPLRAELVCWLTLWLALAAGIGVETEWGKRTTWPLPQTVETSASFTEPVLVEPFRLSPVEAFAETVQRPLFIATRRPAPAAPVAETAKPTMQKDQFMLTGTTVVSGAKFAFLLEKAGNKSRVVAEGKEINGILVKEVGRDRVVLAQHGDTEVLTLKTLKPPPGSSPLLRGAPATVPPPASVSAPGAAAPGDSSAPAAAPESPRRRFPAMQDSQQ